MRRDPSLILTVGVDTLFHSTLLISVFLLFVGHQSPGGGFVAGLVAGAAWVLRYAESDAETVARQTRIAPEALLGVGLLLITGTALAPLLLDRPLLARLTLDLQVPLVGEVVLPSTLVFDSGLFVIVVGVVLMFLQTLGRERAGGEPPP